MNKERVVVLITVCIAVKKHHDRDSSYTGQLIGDDLQVQGSSPLPSRQENDSIQASTMLEESLKVHSHSDILPPTRPHLLIVPLSGQRIFKPPEWFTYTMEYSLAIKNKNIMKFADKWID